MTATTGRDTAALAAGFATALEAVGGRTYPVADTEAARAEVHRIADGRRVTVDNDAMLDEVTAGLERTDDPWDAEVGVTTALAAVGATGTLVLAFDGNNPRRTSLVPPVHIAVVPAERLVPTYQDGIDLLGALRPVPSGMRLVTGPSSSGDIELTLVRGMHGSIQEHVILVGVQPADPEPAP